MPWVNTYDEYQCPIQIYINDGITRRPEGTIALDMASPVLFYKDKRTGQIKFGTVIWVGVVKFKFLFENDQVVCLDKSAIGTRLFRTREEAARRGKVVG